MMILPKNKDELDRVKQDEVRNWVAIGEVLANAKKESPAIRTQFAFGKWLDKWGEEIGLKRATLWRYISAREKYNIFRKRAQRVGCDIPDLREIALEVSPEGIEILNKLSPILDEDEFISLVQDFAYGKVTRKELRDKWNVFKVAKKTGKVVKDEFTRSTLLDVLRLNTSVWLGNERITGKEGKEEKKLDFFKFFLAFRFQENLDNEVNYDVMVGIKDNEDSEIQFHGMKIFTNSLIQNFDWESYTFYSHFTWIALPSEIFNECQNDFPEEFGIIEVREKKLSVIKKPTYNPEPKRISETWYSFLVRWKGQ